MTNHLDNTDFPSEPLYTLTIKAWLMGPLPTDMESFFKGMDQHLSALHPNLSIDRIDATLDWQTEEAEIWAEGADPRVLQETIKTTRQAIAHNKLACHVTMEVLRQLLKMESITFAALSDLVQKQATLQQRAVDLDRLAHSLGQVASARQIDVAAHQPERELLELCRHGALHMSAPGPIHWQPSPELDPTVQIASASSRLDPQALDSLIGRAQAVDDSPAPPFAQIVATFSHVYERPMSPAARDEPPH